MAMNEPYVARLIYKLKHAEDVDYKKAPPIEYENDVFHLHVREHQAIFEFKVFIETEDEARGVTDPFVRSWELRADLELPGDIFRLKYMKAEIEDRKPTPGVVHVHGAVMAISSTEAKLHVGRGKFPQPTEEFAVSPIVEILWDRYLRVMQGRTLLTEAAYFCVDVLGNTCGNDGAAARKYGISAKVLATMRELGSQAGGSEARKYAGVHRELTSGEREFLKQAIKKIVERVAAVEADPQAANTKITKNDLPDL